GARRQKHRRARAPRGAADDDGRRPPHRWAGSRDRGILRRLRLLRRRALDFSRGGRDARGTDAHRPAVAPARRLRDYPVWGGGGASACPQKPSTGIARVTGSALACRIAAAASSRCDARLTMAASGRAARAAWKSGSELTRRGRWPQLVSADAIRVEKSRSSP